MTEKELFRPVRVLDRDIVFKLPTDVQVMFMHRIGKIATTSSSRLNNVSTDDPQYLALADPGMSAVAQLLTMIQNLAQDPLDQDWLTEQMLAGTLELSHITTLIGDLTPEQPVQKAAKKAQPSKARRAAK